MKSLNPVCAMTLFVALGCSSSSKNGEAPSDIYGANKHQGWAAGERTFFHQQSQGAIFLPKTWELALEKPDTTELILSKPNVEAFGMIVDKETPERLPIGFATVTDPNGVEFLGINCAACHTTQIAYKGKTTLVEGGAGMLDLMGFTNQIVLTVVITAATPDKFDRFASRVLGPAAGDPAAKTALQQAFGQVAATFQAMIEGAVQLGLYPTADGPGRMDALGRAANNIFGRLDPTNLNLGDSPVTIPPLWDTPHYDWRHYSGSIRQSLGRDLAQATSSGAPVVLPPGDHQFVSGFDLDAVDAFEEQIGRLKAPRWPESILGSLSQPRVKRGKVIYDSQCASCHNPSVQGDEWVLHSEPLETLGTDPGAALLLANVTVDATSIGLGTERLPLANAFQQLTSAMIERRFVDLGLDDSQRAAMTRGRENLWRAPAAYAARPLRGVWSTPPYLHSGSVPSLHSLLLPAAQREKTFYVGGRRDFDPRTVGYVTGPGDGSGFLFDTAIKGNSNAGHEYGTTLSEEQRTDLIEYLKTL